MEKLTYEEIMVTTNDRDKRMHIKLGKKGVGHTFLLNRKKNIYKF